MDLYRTRFKKIKIYMVFNGTTLETINSVYKISIKLYAELFYL
jgi:hypothetical protein